MQSGSMPTANKRSPCEHSAADRHKPSRGLRIPRTRKPCCTSDLLEVTFWREYILPETFAEYRVGHLAGNLEGGEGGEGGGVLGDKLGIYSIFRRVIFVQSVRSRN